MIDDTINEFVERAKKSLLLPRTAVYFVLIIALDNFIGQVVDVRKSDEEKKKLENNTKYTKILFERTVIV